MARAESKMIMGYLPISVRRRTAGDARPQDTLRRWNRPAQCGLGHRLMDSPDHRRFRAGRHHIATIGVILM